MSDHKERVRRAINNYITKQDAKVSPTRRKNEKPEKLVEADCLVWLRASGFHVQVYESKNQFVNGRWQAAGLKAGNCDCQGTDPNGFAAYIEFKAPGKRSSFNTQKRFKQKQYILEKIERNAFACVVDSVQMLRTTYDMWLALRAVSQLKAMVYLLDCLPQQKEKPEGSDSLGFSED